MNNIYLTFGSDTKTFRQNAIVFRDSNQRLAQAELRTTMQGTAMALRRKAALSVKANPCAVNTDGTPASRVANRPSKPAFEECACTTSG